MLKFYESHHREQAPGSPARTALAAYGSLLTVSLLFAMFVVSAAAAVTLQMADCLTLVDPGTYVL